MADERTWKQHFQIQSVADLDFVIGQMLGWPIGMSRNSPPEFRRRVLAAAVSYQLQLRSIDYALKRYVNPQEYDEEQLSLWDVTSDYLARSVAIREEELRNLHTKGELAFGVLGAELTSYKIPYMLDTARILSNRGLDTLHRDSSRKTSQAVSRITELSGLDDIREIQSFLS